MSHSRALPRHYYDETQRKNVTDELRLMVGGTVRAASRQWINGDQVNVGLCARKIEDATARGGR
jgi:hypothetical protein